MSTKTDHQPDDSAEAQQVRGGDCPRTPCSALPDAAGFYWWRKYPDQEWRMVHIVNFAAGYPGEPPHLVAYDVEYRAWGGRPLRMWAIHDPIGEWLECHKPNDKDLARRALDSE